MKRLFTLYMGLLLPLLSYSQTATLKGRISDAATKEGLPGVHVVADTLAGVTSNENGDYQISVSPGTYKFSFRFIGYDPHEISVTLTAGETKTLDVQLSPKRWMFNSQKQTRNFKRLLFLQDDTNRN
jgi:hypothetical protein